MKDRGKLESVFNQYGFSDFKWIDPREIVTAQWVRTKCMFGCGNYGQRACCPPNVAPVSECTQFFSEYVIGIIFHVTKAVDKATDSNDWGRKINQMLLAVEREVFLLGFQKVFVLPMNTCSICDECTGERENCRNPKLARPTPEGMAIDVYTTARKYNFPINVLADYSQIMNRYAFLLIE